MLAARGLGTFFEDFKKMLEGDQETESGERDNVEACEVSLEDLKKQAWTNKMRLTKLHSRLVKLMTEESVNRGAILIALEDTEEKRLDEIQVLKALVIYEKKGEPEFRPPRRR